MGHCSLLCRERPQGDSAYRELVVNCRILVVLHSRREPALDVSESYEFCELE